MTTSISKNNKRSTSYFAAALIAVMGINAGLSTLAEAGAKRIHQPQRMTVKMGGAQQHTGGAMNLTTPFNANCAQGFSKVGEKKNSAGDWTDWYVCSTPVLTCPAQRQKNGRYSYVQPKAIVQVIGGDPDGGKVSFRVQYKCDYGWHADPEG